MKDNSLTITEKYILGKIEENLKFFCTNNLWNLSLNYHAGETTILRLVKKIGYKSLKDMQLEYYSKYKNLNLTNVWIENESTNNKVLINNVLSKSLYSLVNMIDDYDIETLEKISSLISNSNNVIIFGVGNSSNIGEMFSKSMLKTGKNCKSFKSTREALIALQFSNPHETTVVFYSNIGETIEVVSLAKICNELNLKFILVTSHKSKYLDNDLKKSVATFIYKTHESEKLSFSMIGSQFGQLLFNNIILNMILSKDENIKTNIKNANELINTWNKKKS